MDALQIRFSGEASVWDYLDSFEEEGDHMGFLDDASGFLDRGMSVAKGAVSTVAGEQLVFVRGLCRMCEDGWQQGYHERNGGNASYRLTTADVNNARPFFYDTPSSWVEFGGCAPEMAMDYLLVTAAGSYLRNVAADPVANTGIIEINPAGTAWRVVWGFRGDRRPTSEVAAHIYAQAVRKKATRGASRVLYHAHPTSLVALTAIVPPDAKTMTRILWQSLTESVIAFPGGVGYIGWEVPGSPQLANKTAAQLEKYEACIWQLHGVFASGVDFDSTFGLVNSIDKAADVYLRARAAQGGNPTIPFALSDSDLRATAATYGLPINGDFLA